jgi:hypothetical protein
MACVAQVTPGRIARSGNSPDLISGLVLTRQLVTCLIVLTGSARQSPAGIVPAVSLEGVIMTTTISPAASLEAEMRAIVVARVELRMRTAESANIAKLMATGLSFDQIRDALVAKCMGDPNWKSRLA